jgi:SAM-dependent methyltransferase
LDDPDQISQLVNENGEKFDVIVMLACIEHFFSIDAVLAAIFDLLKPNGLLIVTTPNVASLSYRIYTMFCGNIPVEQGHHVYFFDRRRLWQILFLNAFDVEEVSYYGKTGWYLDRAISYSNNVIRKKIIHLLWKIGLIFGGESLTKAELLAVCRKSAMSKPLGLDFHFRTNAYKKLNTEMRKNVIQRLKPSYQRGLFGDHPGLCGFIAKEISGMKI